MVTQGIFSSPGLVARESGSVLSSLLVWYVAHPFSTRTSGERQAYSKTVSIRLIAGLLSCAGESGFV